MLLNTDYENKQYVLSCFQYSNYICRILRNKVKNISSNMIMIRIYFLMYTFELFHVIIKTRYVYIYQYYLYRYVYQHVSKYPFVNLCQHEPKAWKDILIDNGHEAETTFSPFIQTHLIHLIRVSQKSIVINCDHFYFVPFNSRLVQEMQEIVSFHQLKNLKAESRSKANNCIINDNPRGFII